MAQGERIAFEIEVGAFAEGDLVVSAVRGREGLSEPFAFDVDVTTASGDPIALQDLLGAEAKLFVRRAGGAERVVHGEIERGRLEGVAAGVPRYRLRIAPRLARLARVSRSQIFQELTAADVVAKVLDEHGVAHRASLTASYAVRPYVVQHQETDLAFVSRLLEEEGIGYLFEHGADGHELVLFDDRGAGAELPDALPQRHGEQGEGVDHADRIASGARLATSAVTLRDYDLERPTQDLTAKADGGDLEAYEYPGGYVAQGEGRRRAAVRLAQASERASVWEGLTNVLALLPGATFEVEGAGSLLCVTLAHEGLQERRPGSNAAVAASYRNAFVAVPGDVTWRPPRRTARSRAPGLETATVVGPQGEEIHVDRHGRVKIQLHWDRKGKKDDRSSCWARVAQGWAGAGMGASFVPRIGQEVLVRFLAGDADRPLVVGGVYDGANRTPIALPDDKTLSTQRSSSSPGGDGWNELRLEDAKGAEEIHLHAQKDLNAVVEHDRTADVRGCEEVDVGKELKHTVSGSRTTSVALDAGTEIKGGQTVTVVGLSTEAAGADASAVVKGVRSVTVGGTRTVSVAMASAETVGAASALTVGGAYAVSVGLAENVAVGGVRLEQVIGAKIEVVNKSREEKVQKDRSAKTLGADAIEIGAGARVDVGKDARDEIGKDWVVEVTDGASGLAKAFALQADAFTVKVAGKELLSLAKSGGAVRFQVANLTIDASSKITMKGAKVLKDAGGSGSGQARSQQSQDVKGSVTVRFEVDPKDAASMDDRFVLEATDGSFSQQKTVKDDKKDGDAAVDIEFTDAPLDKKYRLKVIAGGNEIVLLDEAPFYEIAAMLSDPE